MQVALYSAYILSWFSLIFVINTVDANKKRVFVRVSWNANYMRKIICTVQNDSFISDKHEVGPLGIHYYKIGGLVKICVFFSFTSPNINIYAGNAWVYTAYILGMVAQFWRIFEFFQKCDGNLLILVEN